MPAKGKMPLSAAQIEDIAEELDTASKKLRTLSKAMKAKKMKEVQVMNIPMAERGLKAFDRLVFGIMKEVGDY